MIVKLLLFQDFVPMGSKQILIPICQKQLKDEGITGDKILISDFKKKKDYWVGLALWSWHQSLWTPYWVRPRWN